MNLANHSISPIFTISITFPMQMNFNSPKFLPPSLFAKLFYYLSFLLYGNEFFYWRRDDVAYMHVYVCICVCVCVYVCVRVCVCVCACVYIHNHVSNYFIIVKVIFVDHTYLHIINGPIVNGLSYWNLNVSY